MQQLHKTDVSFYHNNNVVNNRRLSSSLFPLLFPEGRFLLTAHQTRIANTVKSSDATSGARCLTSPDAFSKHNKKGKDEVHCSVKDLLMTRQHCHPHTFNLPANISHKQLNCVAPIQC